MDIVKSLYCAPLGVLFLKDCQRGGRIACSKIDTGRGEKISLEPLCGRSCTRRVVDYGVFDLDEKGM